MKISSKARYAIQSMLQLAIQVDNKPVTLAELTAEQGISASYLEQLLASLREHKLVQGVRGPGGGYQLARNASDITISQILYAIHEANMTRPPQSGYNVSVYNDMWWDLSEQIQGFLDDVSLKDMLQNDEVQEFQHRQRLLRDNQPVIGEIPVPGRRRA